MQSEGPGSLGLGELLDHDDSYIAVGILGRTRGIYGDLWVTLLTDFPGRFSDLEEIFVLDRGQWEKRKIESARVIADRPVLKLEGIDTKEDAQRLTNRKLAVPSDQVVPLPDDTYYIFQLIGLKVYEQDCDTPIGEVVDVHQYPANDAYVIRLNDGTQKQLPAVEGFVALVDIENKKMVINTTGLV